MSKSRILDLKKDLLISDNQIEQLDFRIQTSVRNKFVGYAFLLCGLALSYSSELLVIGGIVLIIELINSYYLEKRLKALKKSRLQTQIELLEYETLPG